MNKVIVLVIVLLSTVALAQEVQTDFQVALEPDPSITVITSSPVELGNVEVGVPTYAVLGIRNGNMAKTIQARVVSEEANGWLLAINPGIDEFSVTVGPVGAQMSLTTEWQSIFPMVPYAEHVLTVNYLPPTTETIGGGVEHPFSLQFRLVDE